jgi:hypothetical protein
MPERIGGVISFSAKVCDVRKRWREILRELRDQFPAARTSLGDKP